MKVFKKDNKNKDKLKVRPSLFSLNCTIIFVISAVAIALFVLSTLAITRNQLGILSGIKTGMDMFLNFKFKHLPLIVILFPFITGPIESLIGRRSESLRDTTIVDNTFITLILILLMYPQVLRGQLVYSLPRIFGFGLSFNVDMLSFIMVVISGVMWLAVSIYAHDYMEIEHHRNRFYLWLSMTYGGILGTLMAGDILTMFLFFEIMTFSSYMLVAHNQSDESILAGDSYIYMGVAGGLSLLLGIILLYSYTGVLEFSPLAAEMAELGWKKYLLTLLFTIGFGIKAGMLPLHVWLPKAHPVAPTPASALLSGILIKVGAYGILRVATSFFMPDLSEISGFQDPLWIVSKNVGVIIIWMGMITMAVGVFMALQQSNMKKMLAYHSISQMGYIIMGIGVTSYLGYKGAMGFSGAVYHILNHALFKGLLFMVVGAVYLNTHEIDMYKLGGMWKKMPFAAFVCVIAALGITGMPGFNGFASKSMLHHGIIEAYTYGHYSFKYAEILFTIVSAGTVCSFIKLFKYVFLGPLPEKYKDMPGERGMMNLAMGGLAMIILFIGQAPNYILDQFIIPAARQMSFDPYFIDKYIVDIEFFNRTDMMGMFWIYLMGMGIFIIGTRFDLFHLHGPKWLSVDEILYRPLYGGIRTVSHKVSERYEKAIIASDVMIYAVFLTGILLLLIKFII